MSFDAAVIGSGPNGLCAAIALSRAGRAVVVYEASEQVGGGARTRELTEPGFHHDVCSAIHPMAVGSPGMASLPLAEHGLQWVHPELPFAHPMPEGRAVWLARSIEETASALADDGAAWRRLMAPFVAAWPELAQDAMAPLGIPSHPLLMGRFAWSAFRSAAGLARSRFATDAGRALFAGIAAHSVLPLEHSPSAAIGMMLGIAGHAVGWPMPKGGAQSLSNALRSYFESLGGVVRTDTRISQLAQVETAGPVLFETSTRALAEMGGDALPEDYCARLNRYRYGPGVFKIDYALSDPIPWRNKDVSRAGTVHVGGTLDEICASERAPFAGEHATHPYVLVAQPTLFDAERAPSGKHIGWAYCHVPSGSTRDMTSAIEDQIERFAPGFRDCVIARHTMTSEAFATYNPNYVGGDINGGVPDLRQLFTRPAGWLDPHATPNKRLFLCSAATPPGGGIHGMCGFAAAELALRSTDPSFGVAKTPHRE